MIRRTILHYEVLEKLGQGGMGVVYKARGVEAGEVISLPLRPKRNGCYY